MNKEQLQDFLDRQGTDPTHWPQAERSTVEQLLAQNADAQALLRQAQQLDTLLNGFARADKEDEVAAARVMSRLSTLPAQKQPFWRWPAVLLDWQFMPAWPRVAALASCAVIGFMVGLTGLDRGLQSDGFVQSTSSTNDIASLFEPEPLTGERP